MDRTHPPRYNARAVSRNRLGNLERQFASEIMDHLDHLYRVAFYLTKNEEDARDCVQETYARALGSYRQFTLGTNLKAWLTRILYNFFFDAYARNKRTLAVDLLETTEHKKNFWDTLPSANPGPEKLILQQELAAKIGDAISKIPDEFRAPIVLVDMGDFSYQEAADILSCPIGTIRSRLSRGRRLLEKLLSEYLVQDPKER